MYNKGQESWWRTESYAYHTIQAKISQTMVNLPKGEGENECLL